MDKESPELSMDIPVTDLLAVGRATVDKTPLDWIVRKVPSENPTDTYWEHPLIADIEYNESGLYTSS
jgi:hypothetical protein